MVFLFFENSLPVVRYGRFPFFHVHPFSQKRYKIEPPNFQGWQISLSRCAQWGKRCRPSLPVVTGSDKKNRNFQTFSFKSKPIPLYQASFEVSKTVYPTGSRNVHFRLFQNKVSFSHFSEPYISLINKVFDLKFTYIVDTTNISSNVRKFRKIYFRSSDTVSTNSNICSSFSQK